MWISQEKAMKILPMVVAASKGRGLVSLGDRHRRRFPPTDSGKSRADEAKSSPIPDVAGSGVGGSQGRELDVTQGGGRGDPGGELLVQVQHELVGGTVVDLPLGADHGRRSGGEERVDETEGRAMAMGLIGGVIGAVLGLLVLVFQGDSALPVPVSEIVRSEPVTSALIVAILLAPLLAGIASWLPGLIAARQDPAVVLQGD